MSRIVSFRGLLATTGTIDRINLHTIDGTTGYRIVKFEVMPAQYWNDDYESTVQIFKILKTSPVDAAGNQVIDFSDQTLIGAAIWSSRSSSESYAEDKQIVFDNEIFNQDIYINYDETKTNNGINYYIELEQMPLALDESTVATLKNIRNND